MEMTVYTTGHTSYSSAYGTYFGVTLVCLLVFFVVLMFSQRCRTAWEVHYREIEEYKQRKYLYSEFDTDDAKKGDRNGTIN